MEVLSKQHRVVEVLSSTALWKFTLKWSSTSKWRRYGSRTDERTCTFLEIIGDLVQVEEIGIYAAPPPPPPHTHTHKDRRMGKRNKGINKKTKV